jgi:CheY-like chemotaxis protein
MFRNQVLQILVVDADTYTANESVGTISQNGHIVDYAGTGFEAIEAIQRVPYDLVLMDLQLPDQDGLITTERIRQLPSHRSQVPIMALTLTQNTDLIRCCYAAGMCNFISKPLTTNKFLAVLSFLEFRETQKKKFANS